MRRENPVEVAVEPERRVDPAEVVGIEKFLTELEARVGTLRAGQPARYSRTALDVAWSVLPGIRTAILAIHDRLVRLDVALSKLEDEEERVNEAKR